MGCIIVVAVFLVLIGVCAPSVTSCPRADGSTRYTIGEC